MTLVERLEKLGYDREQAEELYCFYVEKGSLNELKKHIEIKELVMEAVG